LGKLFSLLEAGKGCIVERRVRRGVDALVSESLEKGSVEKDEVVERRVQIVAVFKRIEKGRCKVRPCRVVCFGEHGVGHNVEGVGQEGWELQSQLRPAAASSAKMLRLCQIEEGGAHRHANGGGKVRRVRDRVVLL
jgi:hypothetical protein